MTDSSTTATTTTTTTTTSAPSSTPTTIPVIALDPFYGSRLSRIDVIFHQLKVEGEGCREQVSMDGVTLNREPCYACIFPLKNSFVFPKDFYEYEWVRNYFLREASSCRTAKWVSHTNTVLLTGGVQHLQKSGSVHPFQWLPLSSTDSVSRCILDCSFLSQDNVHHMLGVVNLNNNLKNTFYMDWPNNSTYVFIMLHQFIDWTHFYNIMQRILKNR